MQTNIFQRNAPDSIMKQSPNPQIHQIGILNMAIYKCISNHYTTDQVLITEKQLSHIRDRHPEAYPDPLYYIRQVLDHPDYIIKDKRPHTGLIIKRINSENKHLLLVLRMCISSDKSDYKNSILTGWEISEQRLKNYLSNKQILYKSQ